MDDKSLLRGENKKGNEDVWGGERDLRIKEVCGVIWLRRWEKIRYKEL